MFISEKVIKMARKLIAKITKQGKEFNFVFDLKNRKSKDEFKLKYSKEDQPKNGYEIEIVRYPDYLPFNRDMGPHKIHISIGVTKSGKSKMYESYICRYPEKKYKDAIEVAKAWSRLTVMYLLNGTSFEDSEKEEFNFDQEVYKIMTAGWPTDLIPTTISLLQTETKD